jgi:hypothetical protein
MVKLVGLGLEALHNLFFQHYSKTKDVEILTGIFVGLATELTMDNGLGLV